MDETPQFDNFNDFFMFYISQHSNRTTRIFHAAGTLTGVAIAAKAIIRGPRKQILLAPIVGYGAAWGSHFLIEKNKPASFGHPLWSAMGDMKMLAGMLLGKDNLIQFGADIYLTEHPEARSAGSSIKPGDPGPEAAPETDTASTGEAVIPAPSPAGDAASSEAAPEPSAM